MIKGFNTFKKKYQLQTLSIIQPGLGRILYVLEKLNNPHKQITCIHIAGTNGKGSTIQFLRSILIEAGLNVGTFTSPCFHNVTDQISINSGPISSSDFDYVLKEILDVNGRKELLETLTDFECLTVIAFYYFAFVAKQDIVLIETGLGGEQDATNVIHPLISIITNIGLDHTTFLGETLEAISKEKAGIIKPNVPCITSVEQKDALQVIKNIAKEKRAPFFQFGKDFYLQMQNNDLFSFHHSDGNHIDGLQSGLIGNHQKNNSALAIMCCQLLKHFFSFNLQNDHIINGIKQTYWPGRFEVLSNDPTVILDGAHNPDGVAVLVETLQERFPKKKIHMIFSAMQDKNLSDMIHQLDRIAEQITFVEFDFPRASKAADLFALSNAKNKSFSNHWNNTVRKELESIGREDILLITGSLYFLSEVKPALVQLLNIR